MKGHGGRTRVISLNDQLGHLIPRALVSPDRIERDLVEVMDQQRFLGGFGVPAVPTRYVVRMSPSDRVWFEPDAEEHFGRALARHADDAGLLILGPIEVELEADRTHEPGMPSYWAGFADSDLLVLAAPKAALDVFARA